MPEKCKDCCSRLFCMSVAEVNGEDFETMANKKDCRKRVFTNADRIRAMSDEELATLLNKIVVNHHIKNADNCNHCPLKDAKPCDTEGIIDWLKQPAE